MTFGQSMRPVVLPQAFRAVDPAAGHVLIALTKNTSVAAGVRRDRGDLPRCDNLINDYAGARSRHLPRLRVRLHGHRVGDLGCAASRLERQMTVACGEHQHPLRRARTAGDAAPADRLYSIGTAVVVASPCSRWCCGCYRRRGSSTAEIWEPFQDPDILGALGEGVARDAASRCGRRDRAGARARRRSSRSAGSSDQPSVRCPRPAVVEFFRAVPLWSCCSLFFFLAGSGLDTDGRVGTGRW